MHSSAHGPAALCNAKRQQTRFHGVQRTCGELSGSHQGSGQGTGTRTQVAVKLSSNTHVTVSHSRHSVGRMSAHVLFLILMAVP